jgi:hypothetical protein
LQVVVEEVEMQRELFYTEGEEALLNARKAIAAWSLPRAAQRIAAQKRQQADLQSLQVREGCLFLRVLFLRVCFAAGVGFRRGWLAQRQLGGLEKRASSYACTHAAAEGVGFFARGAFPACMVCGA